MPSQVYVGVRAPKFQRQVRNIHMQSRKYSRRNFPRSLLDKQKSLPQSWITPQDIKECYHRHRWPRKKIFKHTLAEKKAQIYGMRSYEKDVLQILLSPFILIVKIGQLNSMQVKVKNNSSMKDQLQRYS